MSKANIDLAAYPFFKGLDPARLEALATHASVRAVADLEVLFRTGEPADTLYVIKSGHVQLLSEKLESAEDTDPKPYIIRKLNEGETFGWSCLVPPNQWRLDAEASGNAELIVIDGDVVRKECKDHPAFGFEMLKRVAQLMLDRLHAAKFQLTMHSGRPYSQAEGA